MCSTFNRNASAGARRLDGIGQVGDDLGGFEPSDPPPPALRVLLVEDQVLIAMALEADLNDFGLVVSGIAPTVEKALRMINEDAPDLAVLDVNLNGENSMPVAHALWERGIHFVFTTGYDPMLDLPESFRAVPVIGKPYQINEIITALRGE